MENINKQIQKLIYFAQNKLLLDDLDAIYARNLILSELKLDGFALEKIDEKETDKIDDIDQLISPLVEYAAANSVIKIKDKQKLGYIIRYIVSKRPSYLLDVFLEQKEINPKKAKEWLEEYLKHSSYLASSVLSKTDEIAPLKLKNSRAVPKLEEGSIKIVEELIVYASANLFLDDVDVEYVKTRLLIELNEPTPEEIELDVDAIELLSNPSILLENLVTFAIEKKVIKAGSEKEFTDKIMAILSLNPSDVFDVFSSSSKINKAFEWLYDYQIKNGYIDIEKILRNRHFETKTTAHRLEVTVNSKREEKSNAEIEKSLKKESTKYPKCAICIESVGTKKRQTLRQIPISLEDEEWLWQFSPFSYFNQHGVLVSKDHTPMKVNKDSLVRLMQFVKYNPFYFIGVNAALPRIGGSILSHDHFQGGRANMPLFKAPILKKLESKDHSYIKAEVVSWYMPTIRLSYTNEKILAEYAYSIISAWENYQDSKAKIEPKTGTEQHNGACVSARKTPEGFVLDIILRSNSFLAQPPQNAIKGEAVGIIEALGHFILPSRLEKQLVEIEKFVTKERRYAETRLTEELKPFKQMIEKVLEVTPTKATEYEAKLNLKEEISHYCEKILLDCSPFKKQEDFDKFLEKYI